MYSFLRSARHRAARTSFALTFLAHFKVILFHLIVRDGIPTRMAPWKAGPLRSHPRIPAARE
jgi:hypothetical protein